jgi:hypothetical protein
MARIPQKTDGTFIVDDVITNQRYNNLRSKLKKNGYTDDQIDEVLGTKADGRSYGQILSLFKADMKTKKAKKVRNKERKKLTTVAIIATIAVARGK